MRITKAYINDLVYQVIGAAIEVHKALGPGLLESIYHECMKHELSLRGITHTSEMIVPVKFKGIEVKKPLRCDLFVESILPVELKAVEKIPSIHEAQIISYMTLLESPKGLIINFNVTNIYQEGQKTYVNDLYRNLPVE